MARKIDPIIAERLEALRQEKGETITHLAQAIGVSYAHMWEILNNKCKPNFMTIKALAEHFNVSTDYILGLTDTPDPAWAKEGLRRLFRATKGLSERDLEKINRVVEALIPVIQEESRSENESDT